MIPGPPKHRHGPIVVVKVSEPWVLQMCRGCGTLRWERIPERPKPTTTEQYTPVLGIQTIMS